MLDPNPAIFAIDKYDDHGKWMAGWESRRRRIPGNDGCVIQLAVPGTIQGVHIDTSFLLEIFQHQHHLMDVWWVDIRLGQKIGLTCWINKACKVIFISFFKFQKEKVILK